MVCESVLSGLLDGDAGERLKERDGGLSSRGSRPKYTAVCESVAASGSFQVVFKWPKPHRRMFGSLPLLTRKRLYLVWAKRTKRPERRLEFAAFTVRCMIFVPWRENLLSLRTLCLNLVWRSNAPIVITCCYLQVSWVIIEWLIREVSRRSGGSNWHVFLVFFLMFDYVELLLPFHCFSETN